MIRILLKKWFFDIWDNFIPLVVMNVIFVGLAGGLTLLFGHVVQTDFTAAAVVVAVTVLVLYQYMGVVQGITKRITFGEEVTVRDIGGIWKESALHSLGFGLITFAIIASLFFAVPVYQQMGNILALAAIFFMIWMLAFWLCAAQYHYPVLYQLDKRFPKIIRKAFVLFIDNTGFSIFTFFFGVIVFALSGLTAFIVFGPAAVVMFYQTAMKLRMYKYDYLEEHPNAKKKEIPWDKLCAADEERTGRRTLKNMIFPWKD